MICKFAAYGCRSVGLLYPEFETTACTLLWTISHTPSTTIRYKLRKLNQYRCPTVSHSCSFSRIAKIDS